MAVQTGTASGHGDLMRKLRTFLLANDWDEMRWVPVAPLGGQPYLGSSQDGSNAPANAFDGVISGNVGWRTFSGQPVTSWIQVHFDDVVEIDDFRVRAWASNPNRAPKDFTLQYSDNGTSWTTAITVTNQTTWTANESRTFTGASSAHAWWRLSITANNGDATYTEVCELEMRSGGGVNLALSSLSAELIVKGTGLSASDEIYVGMQRYASSTSDWFNWMVQGQIGYVSGNTFGAQPGASPAKGLPLWDQSIPYWFVASGRRFIVVAKISTVYEVMYAGLALPYATPAQYPYPIMVGTTLAAATGTRWSDTSAGHSAFTHTPGSLALRNVSGTWLTPDLHPTNPGAGAALYNYRPAPGDSYPLLPIELNDGGPNRYAYLDSVYFVPGFSAAVEDVVSISGTDYLMVKNVFRNGVRDYFAVRLS